MYPHHGAGRVLKKELKELLGEQREYLTLKILHNDMTVMVPTENAGRAGLRRVIDDEAVEKVISILTDDVTQMPKNWNRRFKHNRSKIKTGNVYELAEVVRNLAIREADKGLSTGEKQMFTRARQILASELMYALEMDAEQVEEHIDDLIAEGHDRAGGNGAAPDLATAESAESNGAAASGVKASANGAQASSNGGKASANGAKASAGKAKAGGAKASANGAKARDAGANGTAPSGRRARTRAKAKAK